MTKLGLIVHPGLVESGNEEVQVLCSCPSGVFAVNAGDRIAQLLLLPIEDQCQGESRPIDSTGVDTAYLLMDLRQRPNLTLTIQGKSFEGILDTGADRSIISAKWWPQSWPLKESDHSLQGLGYASHPTISAQALTWQDSEGHSGSFTPYVLPLPVNLWGRDLLFALGFKLTNDYSPQAQKMMREMGYLPGKGLGRHSSGIIDPLSPKGNQGREGLGFS